MDATSLPLRARCCALLCTKAGLLAELPEGDPVLAPALEAHHWCAATLTPLGPDGEDVALADCQPGRGCFRRVIRASA